MSASHTVDNFRIPFIEAIAEEMFLKPHWNGLSFAQQALLLAAYGCPIDGEERDARGWTRLDYYWASQGCGVFDHLGYLVGIEPHGAYVPQDYHEVWIVAGVRSGKALALDTTVQTPDGPRPIRDIEQGDYVFDESGKPTRVVATSSVYNDHDCYRVTFHDGTEVVADAGHRWTVSSWDDRRNVGRGLPRSAQTLTTAELSQKVWRLRNSGTNMRNWSIRLAQPLQYPHRDLPIDPYLLGVWLGDGTAALAAITSADSEILTAFEDARYKVTKRQAKYAYGICATTGEDGHRNSPTFRGQLSELNLLNNKHIPEMYLTASVEQRLALLQGLMDTDGTSTKDGRTTFYSTNERLAQQTAKLLWSLGVKANIGQKRATLYGKDCGICYVIHFRAEFPVFRLERKKKLQRLGKRRCNWHYIDKIEPVPTVPVKCLCVESESHQFLITERCIPTHNSFQISSTSVVYEAVLGGHEARIPIGKRGFCLQIAQDLRKARESLDGIEAVLSSIPLLQEPYHGVWRGPSTLELNVPKGRRFHRTGERIDLWNGMCVMVTPPIVRAIRGYDSPTAVLDEIGVWNTDADKTNVDRDIFSQVIDRQATFEYPKIFAISSPWAMSGMLYDKFNAGTRGSKVFCTPCAASAPSERNPSCANCTTARGGYRNLLVARMPSAAMFNPTLKHSWLVGKHAEDPIAFRRDCLAEFAPTTAGFLSPDLVDAAVDRGIRERPPFPREKSQLPSFRPFYVAALDPAFRRDAFGFGIGHADEAGHVVIDLLRRWKPVPGQTLNPSDILAEITPLLKAYDIVSAASDQYHFASLEQLALQQGWVISPVPFTGVSKNNLYGNMRTLLNLKRLHLLDYSEAILELKSLQRTLSANNTVLISAPVGMHDDLAAVIALLCSQAVYLDPSEAEQPPKPLTMYEKCLESMRAKQKRQQEMYQD